MHSDSFNLMHLDRLQTILMCLALGLPLYCFLFILSFVFLFSLNYLNIFREFHFDLANVFEHTLFGGFSRFDVVFI